MNASANKTNVPTSMRAIEIKAPGGPEVLAIATRPVPKPGDGEVLVEVHATSVNRLDVFQREGVYPIPPGVTDIPGLDIAGRVVAVGPGVSHVAVGDSVCALVAGGGYAEYCVVHESSCLPVPRGLSMLEAATLPETMFTVWSNVFDRVGLKKGETFLVHGGASGIGISAIQMVTAMGSRVFTTAGSDARCRQCEALGAELAVNYKNEDFVAKLKERTEGKGVDVILDFVGGEYIARNIDLLAVEGRLVQISLLDGGQANINYGPVLLKRLVLTGSTLRARPNAFKRAIAASLHERIWPLLESKTIKPVVSRTFRLEEMADAHRYLMSGDNIGKVAISVRAT